MLSLSDIDIDKYTLEIYIVFSSNWFEFDDLSGEDLFESTAGDDRFDFFDTMISACKGDSINGDILLFLQISMASSSSKARSASKILRILSTWFESSTA